MSASKKISNQRLLSLTSLGAAALAAGAGDAHATIFWSGPITTGNTVGPGIATSALQIAGGLGTAKLTLQLQLVDSGRFAVAFRKSNPAFEGFFQYSSGKAPIGFAAGQHPGNAKVSAPYIPGALRSSSSFVNVLRKGHSFGLFAFKNTNTGHSDFGWARFNVQVGSHTGPIMTLESYAYATGGESIAAGQTKETQVPEPSTGALELTGLAALVMGGPALRRWRAQRRGQRGGAA